MLTIRVYVTAPVQKQANSRKVVPSGGVDEAILSSLGLLESNSQCRTVPCEIGVAFPSLSHKTLRSLCTLAMVGEGFIDAPQVTREGCRPSHTRAGGAGRACARKIEEACECIARHRAREAPLDNMQGRSYTPSKPWDIG